jgi:hypothetical protein
MTDVKTNWATAGFFAVVGIVVICLRGGGAVTTPLMTALAALWVGALGGFLFGTPRILQNDDSSLQTGVREAVREARIVFNTNLVQVSDWLTKIIVGISLVNLRTISHGVDQAAQAVSNSMDTPAQYYPFAYSIIVYYAIIGFIFAYIITTLAMSDAMRRLADELANQ